MSEGSILTFNLSVEDKKNLTKINEPFQIMPATRTYISEKMLDSYFECHNENILLHMNYITLVFSDKAVMNDSKVRYSIKQYTRLADKLGTKDILIHMPYTAAEWENLDFGMNVIKDEICDKGYVVHLEIPAWSKDMCDLMTSKTDDPKIYMSDYLDTVLAYCEEFPEGSFMIVPDTAHLWSDGCVNANQYKYILNRYRNFIKYIHLNGNLSIPFKMDTHTPIFDTTWNKMKCSQEIVDIVAKMNVICVAEVTKYGMDWNYWVENAKRSGLKLVKENYKYTI